ncbi:MAG: hypothetical protein ABIO83_07010 [Ilumatobacteraceae bacterium]
MGLTAELPPRLPADRMQLDRHVVEAYNQDRAIFESAQRAPPPPRQTWSATPPTRPLFPLNPGKAF